MSVTYFYKVGYLPPWIGYYVRADNQYVGAAGFKGRPRNGKVEIAYSTFPAHQNKGIGTAICRQLVMLAMETDPAVIITARTLPEESFSTKILQKNSFSRIGTVMDEDDGDVWEWAYQEIY